jgi:hypothetical protein
MPAFVTQRLWAVAMQPAVAVRGNDKPTLAIALALDADERRDDDGATLL